MTRAIIQPVTRNQISMEVKPPSPVRSTPGPGNNVVTSLKTSGSVLEFGVIKLLLPESSIESSLPNVELLAIFLGLRSSARVVVFNVGNDEALKSAWLFPSVEFERKSGSNVEFNGGISRSVATVPEGKFFAMEESKTFSDGDTKKLSAGRRPTTAGRVVPYGHQLSPDVACGIA